MRTVRAKRELPCRRARLARRSAAIAAACVFAGASGCAHLDARTTDAATSDVPAAWSAADVATAPGDASLARWWLRFDDRVLAGLVADALQANTTVMGAQAALRQSRALRDGAAAGLWPTLTGSGSAQRSSAASALKGGTRVTTDTFQAGLDAQWEIDVFGGRRSALEAGEATLRASAASLADTQVSIAAEVALEYIALRDAQARLAIAGDNLATQRETLQITAWRNQAGLASSLDLEQARSAAEQTAALVPALQTTVDQARHALAVLTGKPPAALAISLGGIGPVPLPADTLALRLPADTLRQRADVRAAEHQVDAARARVHQAEAARLPGFSIGGSLGLSALTLGALTDGASVVGSLLGSVSLPIFDGGAARAQVDAQQAALEQSQSAYRAAVLLALKDVEDALVALRGDRLRLAHLASAADAASNAALLASDRYSSGLVDFQTVLDTQRTRLGTQDALASARADVSSDHVRLYKALGGGWEPETDITRASTP